MNLTSPPPFATVTQPNIASGETRPVRMTGDVVGILECSSDTGVYLRINGTGENLICQKGIKYRLPAGAAFSQIAIVNESGGIVDATLAIGFGDIHDSRLAGSLTVSVQVPASIETAGDAVIPAAATTLVLAADTGRETVLVTNIGATAVRIGDANTGAARGAYLAAGASISLDTSAAVYCYAASGSTLAILTLS